MLHEAEFGDTDPALWAEAGLPDLVRLNRWFGGYRVLAGLLKNLVEPHESFSLLDVGAASGDMGASVRRRYPKATVFSLDREAACLRGAAAPRVLADAFHLPFREHSFDIVFCSLFLHHFAASEVVHLLAAFRETARRALIVLDLERHPLPYYFVPATKWLFRWSPVTVHDSQVSVASGFRREELKALAKRAGLHWPQVRLHRPWFRISLVSRCAR
jgi:2-polyprenyl-3-methyl-5-hydroxy-6-metoxy-1,4-benzoquinol methylase